MFVIEQAIKGKITNRQAAEVLGLSERQVIRLKERMKAEGVAGLAHKNRGRMLFQVVQNFGVPRSLYFLRPIGQLCLTGF
nr:helix-turn-helix domain-containing protein [Moorella thermoacetica]